MAYLEKDMTGLPANNDVADSTAVNDKPVSTGVGTVTDPVEEKRLLRRIDLWCVTTPPAPSTEIAGTERNYLASFL